MTEEAKYPTSFVQSEKRFVLRLNYNENNSFLFVNATKLYQFKAKIKDFALCLANVSKNFTIKNMKKKIRSKGVVEIVSNVLNITDNNNILKIQKYLMKRT